MTGAERQGSWVLRASEVSLEARASASLPNAGRAKAQPRCVRQREGGREREGEKERKRERRRERERESARGRDE